MRAHMDEQVRAGADPTDPRAGAVERDDQLARLVALAARVQSSGRSAAAIVRGEPGIGKSTLLDLAVAALEPEWSVLRVGGRALGVDRAHEVGRRLVRRIVGRPSLAGTTPPELPDGLDDLVALLTRLAATGPVAVVVDDLHWVDAESIGTFDLLWTELAEAGVLWLVATRDVEAADRRSVAAWMHRLERERGTEQVPVPRLSFAAVRQLCRVAGGGADSDDVARRIHTRSRGNPLLVDALIRSPSSVDATADHDGPIPGYIHEVFAGQLAGLLPAERDVLLVVACLDAPVTEDDMVRLTSSLGLSPAAARSAIAVLGARRLVERSGDGALAVAHPVVGEIALHVHRDAALPRVAASLVTDRADVLDPLDAARLVVLAGDHVPAALAVRLLTDAADQAYARASADLAVHWMHDAVHHAGRVPEPERPALLASTLVRAAGHLDGDPARAMLLAGQALEVAEAAGLLVHAADAALTLARLGRSVGDAAGTRTMIERAISFVIGAPAGVELRVRETALRLALLVEMPAGELERMVDELRSVALAHGRPERIEAAEFILWSQGIHRFGRNDWRRMREATIWRMGERDSPFAVMRRVIELDGALIDGAWPTVERLTADAQIPVWRRLLARFELAWVSGRWDEAQRVLDRAGTLVHHPSIRCMQAWLDVHRGGTPEPGLAPDREPPEFGSVGELVVAYGAVLRGAPVEVPAFPYEDWFLTMQECRLRPALAEVCVAAGDLARAARAIERIDAMSVPGSRMEAAWHRVRGTLAAHQGDHVAADEAWGLAEAGFRRLGMPYDAANAELMRLASRHERGEAVDEGRVADLAALFDDLGAVPSSAVARRLVPVRSVAPTGSLTRRELEIARLVAGGRSNAQIAAELFVSVRTVTSHLDHAYTKLGIGSRAALAVYVHELDRNT